MKLTKNKFFLNIIKVALSNVTTILAGVVAGFLLPKIIGVTNYGYYKTFSLYISYVSIFQFGIMEGIYLKFGGIDYDQLDKKLFRFYSQFLVLLEFFTSIFFVIISLLVFNNDYQFIFVCVSLFACLFGERSRFVRESGFFFYLSIIPQNIVSYFTSINSNST